MFWTIGINPFPKQINFRGLFRFLINVKRPLNLPLNSDELNNVDACCEILR